jgi:hypothetical protein
MTPRNRDRIVRQVESEQTLEADEAEAKLRAAVSKVT